MLGKTRKRLYLHFPYHLSTRICRERQLAETGNDGNQEKKVSEVLIVFYMQDILCLSCVIIYYIYVTLLSLYNMIDKKCAGFTARISSVLHRFGILNSKN
jgi:hypothetical protein